MPARIALLSTAVAAPRPPRRSESRRPGIRDRPHRLFAARVSPILRHDGPIRAPTRVTPGRLDPRRAMVSPLGSWFPGDRALAGFHRRALGRVPAVLPPRDRAWRAIAPDFAACVRMAGSGLPFQIAAERQVDRSGDPRRLAAALASGQTAYLPQVHQVLPRLMRLMVSLRSAFFRPAPGSAREECSFLFIVEGAGRAGMGLHHDGDVDAFWLQLEGRRTVTIGPRVPPGTPEELEDRTPRRGRRAGMAHLRPRARHAVPPAGADTARGRVPAPLAGRHAHMEASRAAGRALRAPPAPAGGAPLVGRGVRIRRADSAGAPRARSGPRCPSSLAGSAASATFACGRPTAKDRGCRPGQAPGPTVSA